MSEGPEAPVDRLVVPANIAVLEHLERGKDPARRRLSGPPSSVPDPYLGLGSHPDLVARLWDGITKELPEDCRWIVRGTPALVHPKTGVIFAFSGGTHCYAMRLPPKEREEARRKGAKATHRYSNGATADLAPLGEEWLFCGWEKEEPRWCQAAHTLAEN